MPVPDTYPQCEPASTPQPTAAGVAQPHGRTGQGVASVLEQLIQSTGRRGKSQEDGALDGKPGPDAA
jgi:hypothetical protein